MRGHMKNDRYKVMQWQAPDESDRCVLLSDNGTSRCEKRIRNITTKACAMHYARMQRHGTYEKLPNGAINFKGKHETTLEFDAKRMKKAAEQAELKEATKRHPCMCGHIAKDHRKSMRGPCKITSCRCKHYEPANAEAFAAKTAKLFHLGFHKHLNTTAVCTSCNERIVIGAWWDDLAARRAVAHKTNICASLRRKSVTGQ